MELGEFDLGIRTFLAQAGAEEYSQEDRERGHDGTGDQVTTPRASELVTSHPRIYPASGQFTDVILSEKASQFLNAYLLNIQTNIFLPELQC